MPSEKNDGQGFLREAFLNRSEKDTLAKWASKLEDESFLCRILDPFFNLVAQLIPSNVSSNVFSFVGLLCSILAWEWSCRQNLQFIELLSVALFFFVCLICDKLDGIHARATYNASPLVELIEQWSMCLSVTFIALSVCNLFGITDPSQIHIMVLSFSCISMARHLSAFTDPNGVVKVGHFTRTGPSERFFVLILGTATRDMWFFPEVSFILFSATVGFGVLSVLSMWWTAGRYFLAHRDYSTQFGMIVCFSIQAGKFARQFLNNSHTDYGAVTNGVIFSTLCGDLILAKMARRQLHPLVPVMHLVSLSYEMSSVPLALCYYYVNLFDIATHLKLSILNPVRNILVTGYYDGLHVGHIASLVVWCVFHACMYAMYMCILSTTLLGEAGGRARHCIFKAHIRVYSYHRTHRVGEPIVLY
jgi:hypothetical protein